MDNRKAVFAEEAELELLPRLLIDRAVPAQPPASVVFQTKLVIGQEIGIVRRKTRRRLIPPGRKPFDQVA